MRLWKSVLSWWNYTIPRQLLDLSDSIIYLLWSYCERKSFLMMKRPLRHSKLFLFWFICIKWLSVRMLSLNGLGLFLFLFLFLEMKILFLRLLRMGLVLFLTIRPFRLNWELLHELLLQLSRCLQLLLLFRC